MKGKVKFRHVRFHTSPVSSVQRLSNKLPLHLCREELAIKYSIKLYSNPSNLTYNTIFYQQHSALFNTKRGAIPPLSLRRTPSYSLLNTNNSPVAVNKFCPVPSCTLNPPPPYSSPQLCYKH